jgi:ABC-type sugar transport system substrate-binding protein
MLVSTVSKLALQVQHLLVPVNADWDTTKALDAAKAMLAANPDIAGFFAANDQMAQGIGQAIKEAKKNIPVFGVDGIPDILTPYPERNSCWFSFTISIRNGKDGR